ncbi:MAG: hypothetical protein JJU20_02290 [Opitutales bacterium]|nr:hypothetical protein [Opitutales bacterium]
MRKQAVNADHSTRSSAISSLILLAASVCIIALMIVPQWVELNQERARIDRLQYDIQQQRTFAPVYSQFTGRLAGLSWEVAETVPDKLPVSELANLSDRFQSLSPDSGIQIHSASPQAGAAGSRDGLQRAQAQASGSFSQIQQFLVDFESAGFLGHIESLSISVEENHKQIKWAAWLRME